MGLRTMCLRNLASSPNSCSISKHSNTTSLCLHLYSARILILRVIIQYLIYSNNKSKYKNTRLYMCIHIYTHILVYIVYYNLVYPLW